jgi:hypothetical protein
MGRSAGRRVRVRGDFAGRREIAAGPASQDAHAPTLRTSTPHIVRSALSSHASSLSAILWRVLSLSETQESRDSSCRRLDLSGSYPACSYAFMARGSAYRVAYRRVSGNYRTAPRHSQGQLVARADRAGVGDGHYLETGTTYRHAVICPESRALLTDVGIAVPGDTPSATSSLSAQPRCAAQTTK